MVPGASFSYKPLLMLIINCTVSFEPFIDFINQQMSLIKRTFQKNNTHLDARFSKLSSCLVQWLLSLTLHCGRIFHLCFKREKLRYCLFTEKICIINCMCCFLHQRQ